jgi:ribosome-associated translation inhibitor RaiA
MTTSPRIVWKGVEPSAALAQRIARGIDELDRTYRRITACRVAIEAPHQHQRHGKHYQVKIELVVPGRVLTVSRDPAAHSAAADAYSAVNEAFSEMRRQLADFVRTERDAHRLRAS